MASSKVLKELRQLYQNPQERLIELSNYSGAPFDVAFDITTEDTFIAGIASKILDGTGVSWEERQIIGDSRLEGDRWRGDDDEFFDLGPYPEINAAAKRVEEFRAKCVEALS